MSIDSTVRSFSASGPVPFNTCNNENFIYITVDAFVSSNNDERFALLNEKPTKYY